MSQGPVVSQSHGADAPAGRIRRLGARLRHAWGSPVRRPLVKFAIYAAACLVLLGALAGRVGNIRKIPFFSHEHTYYADLSDASTLVPPDDVKIAGVTVGQVKGVSVHHGYAVVRFVVDRGTKLRESTQVGMRFQNLIGDKYLYLYPGTSGAFAKPGYTFPLSQSVPGADVGDFLNDLGGFLKALNPEDVNAFTDSIVQALEDNDAQVSQLLANTATVSQTVGGLDSQLGSVIDNLQQLFSALAARDADLAAVADHLASLSQQLASRNDVLDQVVTNFGTVNGELDQLLTTNHGNVDQLISNLQTIANVLAQHHGDLSKDLATLSEGLAPYTLISNLGQWFQIRVVYTCLAAQTSCVYEQPASNQGVAPISLGTAAAPPEASAGASPAVAGALAPPASGSAGLSEIIGFAVSGSPS